MKELLDIYDKDKNLTGKIIERGTKLEEGEYSLVACIVVKDGDNFLITQRDERKSCGLMWEFTGGSVVSGEKSIDGAIRELREETGIKATKEQLEYIGNIVYDKFPVLLDLYVVNRTINIDEIVLQEGETIDAKVVSMEEIINLHNNNLFTDVDWQVFNFIYRDCI